MLSSCEDGNSLCSFVLAQYGRVTNRNAIANTARSIAARRKIRWVAEPLSHTPMGNLTIPDP